MISMSKSKNCINWKGKRVCCFDKCIKLLSISNLKTPPLKRIMKGFWNELLVLLHSNDIMTKLNKGKEEVKIKRESCE
jgi:hypothetical protein